MNGAPTFRRAPGSSGCVVSDEQKRAGGESGGGEVAW